MKTEIDSDTRKEIAEFRALVRATESDQPGAAQKLNEFARAHPWVTKILDLQTRISGQLIDKLAGAKPSNDVLITVQVDNKRDALGYQEAGELERMLIDRMMMCWLRLVIAESYCSQLNGKVTTFKERDFAERNLTRANSRFLKATDALERYRLMTQATRFAKAKADLIEAKAVQVREDRPKGDIRLVKSGTG